MRLTKPYPWQQTIWQQVQSTRQQQRLGHALLLTGVSGLGKLAFAQLLSQSLLCTQPDAQGLPCQQCHQCQLVLAGNHPDHYLVQPAEAGQAIKVDAIRHLTQVVAQTRHSAEYRTVILAPAQAMNHAAANALLKTLEEPSQQTVLMLVSDQTHLLPATLLSRCQRITFSSQSHLEEKLAFLADDSDPATARILLRRAQGAPLLVKDWLASEQLTERQAVISALEQLLDVQQDPISITQTLMTYDWGLTLDWIIEWLNDILRGHAGIAKEFLLDADKIETIIAQQPNIKPHRLYLLLDSLLEYKQQALSNISLNKQLQLEQFSYQLRQCF